MFDSLVGTPWEIVLSELIVSEIIADDGVKNIVKTLDSYFMGNETHNAYNAIDELFSYKRDKDSSVEDFICNFNWKSI